MSDEANRYIVIGGSPYRGYTGTLSYTGLKTIYRGNELEAAKKFVKDKYEECGGLIALFDTFTGEDI